MQKDLDTAVVDLNSNINQTAESINLEVSKKVGKNEIKSAINQSAEEIQIQAKNIALEGYTTINKNFSIDTKGNMSCNNASINGGKVEVYGGTSTNTNLCIYKNKDSRNDAMYIGYKSIYIEQESASNQPSGVFLNQKSTAAYLEIDNKGVPELYLDDNDNITIIKSSGISTPKVAQGSLEKLKKNIELSDNCLEDIKNADIYKYNLKCEEDSEKKHYGFIIGKNRNTPEKVIADTGDGIDTYSMISVLWKGVQELTEKVEELEEKLDEKN